jgi:DNA-binding transcriptional regulator LsrR (DeoR family)
MDPSQETEWYAQAVAVLHREGLPPKDIAYHLGCSVSYVTKLKQKAEGRWLDSRPRVKNIPANRIRAIRARYLQSDRLRRSLGVRDVRIFYGSRDDFLRAASDRVAQLLRRPRVRNVGVAWGSTVGATGVGLEGYFPPFKKRHTWFFPLRGGLLHTARQASILELPSRLDEIVNGGAGSFDSLGAVPAVLPDLGGGVKVLKDYFETTGSYIRVRARLVKADMMLTSVGPVGPVNDFTREYLRAAGIAEKDLRARVVGDIAGCLIPRAGLSLEDRALVARWNGQSLMVTLPDFTECDRRARRLGLPGVIVVAAGARRAAAVLSCCAGLGVVTELLIDGRLAGRLSALTKPGPLAR